MHYAVLRTSSVSVIIVALPNLKKIINLLNLNAIKPDLHLYV